MNLINWYQAQAFCVWDGGRLATLAESNYAASGGAEQRVYPWGNTAPGPDAALAIYRCYYQGTGKAPCLSPLSIAPVGSAPAGNGKWGQADLTGNLLEWVQDAAFVTINTVDKKLPNPCTDCSYFGPGPASYGDERLLLGGIFQTLPWL